MSKILYLMGASGSGKDSILSALRQQLSDDSTLSSLNVMIAHRYICRDWKSGNENHIQLTTQEFERRQQLGFFALDWHANGLQYGIGLEIEIWLAEGQYVVVNGSREHLATAKRLYEDNLIPIIIEVDDDILRQRLIQRGRESLEDIAARLVRTREQKKANASLLSHCHTIHNNGRIEDAVQQLMLLIYSFTKE